MTTFFFIRHGNTDVRERITGRSPGIHLSESGLRQAEALAERLARIPLNAVCSSPMERTRETAELVAKHHALKVNVLADLVEIEFGDWTNRTFEELRPLPQWQHFHTFRSGTRIPGGELMLEVQTRLVGAVERLRREFPDGSIAVVSHGDPIRTLLAYYTGLSLDLMLRLTVDTASVSVVMIGDAGATLLCMNHTGPLPRY